MPLIQMTQRLLSKTNFEQAIQTILGDVMALHGAERGTLQLEVGEELALVAQRGFSGSFLEVFKRVKKDEGAVCGRALRLGNQVVVRDVMVDPEFAPFRGVALKSGYRAVQSSPLIASDGRLLGVVSTHFALVHEPTPIEMHTLKDYSVIAADHAYSLLGDVALAPKAEQMSDALYADARSARIVTAA